MAAVDDTSGARWLNEAPLGKSRETAYPTSPTSTNGSRAADEEDEEEEDDEQEPTLKYAKLTSHLASVYRGGDSTSASQVTGDKLVIGTHNGVVHVYSIPSLQSIRQYRAHSSSITNVSVSPSTPYFTAQPEGEKIRTSSNLNTTPRREPPSASHASPGSPRQPVPATPSNSIYIATASIDGHVCVTSLVDSKDVTLRNYSRPVHAVALSPNFKTDRTYLSGGTAGNLVCTVGGKAGVSSEANTNSAAAAASGWLGSIGLGSNTGKDTVIHSGEGTVTAINWSSTGKYVAWNNEFGTRIMHSHLSEVDSELAWKRIGHVPRNDREGWEDMAGVWKARTQWIDPQYLESGDGAGAAPPNGTRSPIPDSSSLSSRKPQSPGPRSIKSPRKKRVERLLIGWGDTVWMIHIHGRSTSAGKTTSAKAEQIHRFWFEDCIISGLTLYTPSTLVAIVFRTVDDNGNPISIASEGTNNRRGRRSGLPPELRLINLATPSKDEIEAESVVVSRFENLTFVDYHLSTLYVPPASMVAPGQASRGALGFLGEGLMDVGYSTTRLFSSGASVLSGSSSGERTLASSGQTTQVKSPSKEIARDAPPALLSSGLKIFIQSPFDCVLAIRRDLSDQFTWHLNHEEYEAAYSLVQTHPEVLSRSGPSESTPSTPTRSGQSLADFWESSSQSTIGPENPGDAHSGSGERIPRELQRIGDLWIGKLVKAGAWAEAGQVANKSLQSAKKWEDWILVFTENGKFDEISSCAPTAQLKPPLPSYVYEVILNHYVAHDRLRLRELLDVWSPSLFDASAVSNKIETYLESGEANENTVEDGVKSRDWRILTESLAKLYLADARPTDAIHCYLRTGKKDAVLDVIKEFSKIDAIAENIWDFVLLEASDTHLEDSLPITMLAKAGTQGVIDPSTVVIQLQAKGPGSRPYLFSYFRQLWRPDVSREANATADDGTFVKRPRFAPTEPMESASRALLAPFADNVVSLFAEYSQQLLNEYLKVSNDYSFEHASDECRTRHYIPELVYLLWKTGQTKNALHLIIDELGDVPMAISFVRDTDDGSLWSDLLDYSMDKPEFIRGMLEDVGTSVDPVALVKRIPQGLRVDGLKGSLMKLLRESEITWSISDGASKVLESEISTVLDQLRRRRERGVIFEVTDTNEDETDAPSQPSTKAVKKSSDGRCISCDTRYDDTEEADTEDYLIAFICGHVFHLTCLLDSIEDETNKAEIARLQKQLAAEEESQSPPTIGTKIRHAQMIKGVLKTTECLKCQSLKG